MKIKSTAIALAACATALSATFVGCGEEPATETTTATEAAKYTSIPVTGSYSYDVTKWTADGYVDYTVTGVDFIDGESAAGYYCEDSIIPYIIVWTTPKNGRTLEEYGKERSNKFTTYNGGTGYYQVTNNPDYYAGATCVSYYHSSDNSIVKDILGDGYYYITNDIIEDGDNFIEISYYQKSEEVALGDTGKKAWIPAGYSNVITDDLKNSDVLLFSSYKNVAVPDILLRRIDTENDTFEKVQTMFNKLLEGDYTSAEIEEIFNAAVESDWDEESHRNFLSAMDCDVETFATFDNNNINITFMRYSNEKAKYETTIATFGDNEKYSLILRSTDTPFPAFSQAVIESIH